MSPESTDRDPAWANLAQFQADLLDLLHQPITVEEIQRRLRTDPQFDGCREYVESMEPRMLRIAAELTKKWGVRKE